MGCGEKLVMGHQRPENIHEIQVDKLCASHLRVAAYLLILRLAPKAVIYSAFICIHSRLLVPVTVPLGPGLPNNIPTFCQGLASVAATN